MDKCGPEGKSIIERVLSWIVPDVLFGRFLPAVNLCKACGNHDRKWKKNGANKKDDLEFRDQIRDAFFVAERMEWNVLQVNAWAILGFLVAWWYFIGVRFGGIFYKIDEKLGE